MAPVARLVVHEPEPVVEPLRSAHLVLSGGPSLYRAGRRAHPCVHCLPSPLDAAHFGFQPQLDTGLGGMSIEKGDDVMVMATVDGDTATAVSVVEQGELREGPRKGLPGPGEGT